VLAVRADKLLKALKHARLDHSHEAELRKLLAVDVLLVDDFGLDAMDATESRDVHEILTERDRAGSMIITSNAGPTNGSPLRRSGSGSSRDRSVHLERLRPRDRGRVVSEAPQAEVSRREGWTEEGLIGQLITVTRRQEPGGMVLRRQGP